MMCISNNTSFNSHTTWKLSMVKEELGTQYKQFNILKELRHLKVLDQKNIPTKKYEILGYFQDRQFFTRNNCHFSVVYVTINGLEFIKSILDKKILDNNNYQTLLPL